MASGIRSQGRCRMTFDQQRAAALAVLGCDSRLTRKAGSFLGQLCVDDTPLSPAQVEWFETLCDRAGVPFPGDSSDD